MKPPRQIKSPPSYKCTECGGDAFIGFTKWSGPDGEIVSKNERLCSRCLAKRGIQFSFTSKTP